MATVTATLVDWENLSPDKVAARLEKADGDLEVPALQTWGKLPSTWVFRTREGGMGLMQITGFTENPHGVKIRYKLVSSTR
jgi:hypothetical protein